MRPAVEEARAAAARSTLCRIGAVRRAGALGWGGGDAGPWAEALRVAPEDPSPRLLQRPPAASGSPAQLRRRDRPGPVDPPEPAARPPPTAVRLPGTPRPTGPAGRRAGGPRHRRRASGRPPGRPGQRTPMAARCPPFWRTPPELPSFLEDHGLRWLDRMKTESRSASGGGSEERTMAPSRCRMLGDGGQAYRAYFACEASVSGGSTVLYGWVR
jgi:hypothetical protein